MKKAILKLFMISFVSVFISSCSSELDETVKPETAIEIENGYLVFPDNESFEATIKLNNNRSDSDIKSWEAELGFFSMQSMYKKAIQSDLALFESLYSEINDVVNQIPHSDYVKYNKDFLIINDDGSIDANTFRYETVSVLNPAGLVRIGNILYRYSMNDLLAVPVAEGQPNEKIVNYLITEDDKLLTKDQRSTVFKSEVIHQVGFTGVHNKRSSFYSTCKSSGSSWDVHGEVRLSTVLIPEYGYFPCGSITCELGGPGSSPTVDCSPGGQCMVQIDTDFRSTYEHKIRYTFFGFPSKTDLSISGSYRNFGNMTSFDHSENNVSSFRRTLLSVRTENNIPVDITDASHTFSDEFFRDCTISFN